MKRIDTYRTIDLVCQGMLAVLLLVFIMVMKIAGPSLKQYAPSIADTPFFVAFLPLAISSCLHIALEYGQNGKGEGSLILLGETAPRPKLVLLKSGLSLAGVLVPVLFAILGSIFAWGWLGDKVWVAFLLCGFLPSFLFEACLAVISLWRGSGKKRIMSLVGIAVCCALVLAGLLCFYLDAPAYCFCLTIALPLGYLLGDDASLSPQAKQMDEEGN